MTPTARNLFVMIAVMQGLVGLLSAQELDQDALIEDILRLSGTKAQLAHISAAIDTKFNERAGELPPEIYPELRRILSESYHAEALYQTIVETFHAQFDQAG